MLKLHGYKPGNSILQSTFIYSFEYVLVHLYAESSVIDSGNLDLHTGTVRWSDGLSVDLDDIALGNRTFSTSRFLSEDELEDNFPEINDDDNDSPGENFPGELDEDDIYKLGVDISLEDDDMGMDTKPFEFFVSEQGGTFIPEML